MLQLEEGKGTFRVKNLITANPDLVFEPVVSDYPYKVVIPPRYLRGLRVNGNLDEFTIFHKRAPENPNAPLSKDGRVRASPDTQKLEVDVWDVERQSSVSWLDAHSLSMRLFDLLLPW